MGNILVIALILAVVWGAVHVMRKDRKAGKHCAGCPGCGGSCGCHEGRPS